MSAAENANELMPRPPAAVNGPEWWQAARKRAAAGLSLPTVRDEAWKYTSLKALEKRRFAPFTGAVPEPGIRGWCPEDAVVLSFVDGVLRDVESVQQSLPSGVRLELAPESDDAWSRSTLESDWQGAADALARLNTAQCQQVWLLEVADNVQLTRPVVVELISAEAEDTHPRLLIKVGRGSGLRLLETNVAAADNAFTNLLVQARVADGAVLEHVHVQQAGPSDLLITRWDVEVAASARYEHLNIDLGGQLVRHDRNIELVGPEAETTLRGVYPLTGRQHVDNHIRVSHRVGDTRSAMEYRGVLSGRGRGVFNGKALIAAGADGSDVVQSNANLLLSDHAEIDTKPELEIYADDVTASHGATVGQLQDDAVFYLQSRGIPEQRARRMLTRGFLQAVTAAPEWLDAMALDQAVATAVEKL